MTESIYDTSEEPNTLTPKLIYQSPTLFSELFPDPSIHPRASIRAASTGIVCILLFVSLFLGFIQERPSQLELIRKGQEWTQLDSLDVRLKKMEELEMEEGFRTSSVWAGEWDDTEKDGSSEKEDPTYSKAAIVKEQLLDGTISNYVWHESLESNTTFMTEGRLIVVGDIHGKHASLSSLLARIDYKNATDTLMHVGDLCAKSPLNDSLETVRMMRSLSSKGVRGNHDQGVIEWRNLFKAYGTNLQLANTTKSDSNDTSNSPSFSTTKHLSHLLDHHSLSSNGALLGKDWSWLDHEESALKELGVEIPSEWKGTTRGWGGDWFEIARHLPSDDFDYLQSLPLTLFIPEIKSYIVHAGMLPWTSSPSHTDNLGNLTNSSTNLLESTSKSTFSPTVAIQELIISSPAQSLLLVEQNSQPFTLLNMRGVKTKKNSHHWTVEKSKKGTAWFKIWNGAMEKTRKEDHVNLIYGHWAGKGLTLNPHSIGLDSGCVYGNRLSASVLSTSTTSPLSRSTRYQRTEDSSSGSRKKRQRGIMSDQESEEEVERMQGLEGARERLRDSPDAEEDEVEDDEEETVEILKSSKAKFQEETVTLDGKSGWIVSVDCAG